MDKNTIKLIGWREWVSLPDLRIPAIKTKVDTGAKTSALHAFKLEEISKNGLKYIRFHIHPVQKNNDLIVTCESIVSDVRIVRDSGGHREKRYVIRTSINLGSNTWPIEVTLTSRDDMMFRMLLGRTALIDGGFTVDPTQAYLVSNRPKNLTSLYPGESV